MMPCSRKRLPRNGSGHPNVAPVRLKESDMLLTEQDLVIPANAGCQAALEQIASHLANTLGTPSAESDCSPVLKGE